MRFDTYYQFLNVRPKELKTLAWSLLYVFSLFVAYYLLRPVRDELGVAGGVNNLPWLFSGTLVAMLLLTPLFSCLVKRYQRITVIRLSYHFFASNLLLFFVLLLPAFNEYRVWTGRLFFIWLSVFNLFVVSLFWSLIVDIFTSEQGMRLFGMLSAGATLGALIGSSLTLAAVERIDQRGLLLLAFLLLEISLLSAQRAAAHSSNFAGATADRPVGGTVLAGITHTLRSPYLAGIALFMMFYSVTSTLLYFEQATIAANAFSDRASRTAFFATIDMWVNFFTLIAQIFFTSRALKGLGVSLTLAILPLVTLAGFSLLLACPSLLIFVVFQVARRISNFAFARPSREILFTRVAKEERYKSKNFIDTVVYRLGDQMGSWSYAGLMGLAGSASLLAYIAIPLSLVWLALSVWLGRQSPLIPLNSGGD